MREIISESHLKKGIECLDGMCLKFTSPGRTGVPDRIVLLPGGRVIFVEMKADKKNLSKIQDYMIGEIRSVGCEVIVLHGREEVRAFLERLKHEI